MSWPSWHSDEGGERGGRGHVTHPESAENGKDSRMHHCQDSFRCFGPRILESVAQFQTSSLGSILKRCLLSAAWGTLAADRTGCASGTLFTRLQNPNTWFGLLLQGWEDALSTFIVPPEADMTCASRLPSTSQVKRPHSLVVTTQFI